MAKYQGAYRADLDKEDEVPQQEQQEEAVNTAPLNAEEDTFKKRYGDLRRHSQGVKQKYEDELAKLQGQLADATKAQIKFPKTEEEIDSWSKRYPDVAAVIDTIAKKRSLEVLEIGEQKMERLKNLEDTIVRERAEKELKDAHPDFDEIRMDKGFHEWVATQPQSIQDSLYKNTTDARVAARSIDLYKADMGILKTKGKKPSRKDAAQSVGRSSRTAPQGSVQATFSESMVSKMSAQEYDANEEAIMESMKTGKFEYDLSGAAR